MSDGGRMVPRIKAVGTSVAVPIQLPRSGYIENVGDYTVYISDTGPDFAASDADEKRVIKLTAGSIVNFEGMNASHTYWMLAVTGASYVCIVGVV